MNTEEILLGGAIALIIALISFWLGKRQSDKQHREQMELMREQFEEQKRQWQQKQREKNAPGLTQMRSGPAEPGVSTSWTQ